MPPLASLARRQSCPKSPSALALQIFESARSEIRGSAAHKLVYLGHLGQTKGWLLEYVMAAMRTSGQSRYPCFPSGLYGNQQVLVMDICKRDRFAFEYQSRLQSVHYPPLGNLIIWNKQNHARNSTAAVGLLRRLCHMGRSVADKVSPIRGH
jgi:hypothetical protein